MTRQDKKKYPKKYIPKYLSNENAEKIKKEINKSQKLYKKGKYHIRKNVKSMKMIKIQSMSSMRRKYTT